MVNSVRVLGGEKRRARGRRRKRDMGKHARRKNIYSGRSEAECLWKLGVVSTISDLARVTQTKLPTEILYRSKRSEAIIASPIRATCASGLDLLADATVPARSPRPHHLPLSIRHSSHRSRISASHHIMGNVRLLSCTSPRSRPNTQNFHRDHRVLRQLRRGKEMPPKGQTQRRAKPRLTKPQRISFA